ncbi:hypothetical protein [Jeotgalibacillus campisalis]|uniref:Stage III sporulation protein AG n=1 Tax=Jeotgalibacillus campisalis TaxID=220754 RepID=A0A0C2R6T2_9BACL|nr:hypothetical protein [Jeotgalibacillus campisalis]KIL45950.1 hypothetical protein KR50_26250 [Jeotgalibacillus campisalis]
MADKKGWDKLRDWIASSRDPTSNRKLQLVMVLVVAGALMMLLQGTKPPAQELPSNPANAVSESESLKDEPIREMEKDIEKQLADILKKALGTNDVNVMVNLATSERKIYEKNETLQQDQSSDQRENEESSMDRRSSTRELVLGNQGQNGDPILSYVEKPTVLGVMIVAEGADNIKVKKWITESVARVMDISTHRVAVISTKQKES